MSTLVNWYRTVKLMRAMTTPTYLTWIVRWETIAPPPNVFTSICIFENVAAVKTFFHFRLFRWKWRAPPFYLLFRSLVLFEAIFLLLGLNNIITCRVSAFYWSNRSLFQDLPFLIVSCMIAGKFKWEWVVLHWCKVLWKYKQVYKSLVWTKHISAAGIC